jgi:hypothetical protein
MKEVKVRVYELDELEPSVKETVIYNAGQNIVASDWYTPITEGFREEMECIGIIDADTYFSGFYSQGDGACFICDTIDTDLLIRTLFETGYDISEDIVLETENMNVIIQKLDNSFARQYDHENTIAARINYEGDIISLGDIDKLEHIITMWAREASIGHYRNLEAYYDELTSDTHVSSELSGCLYFKDGRIANSFIIPEEI